MKQTEIKPKKCQNPECDQTFIPRKSFDKFCSWPCAKPYVKPLERKPIERKPIQPNGSKAKRKRIYKPIKPMSDKLKRWTAKYMIIKNEFLNRPENKICPVFPSLNYSTTDVHHMKGRGLGFADDWAKQNNIPLLIDTRFFLAVSRKGHRWIHDHDKEARERGFIIDRLSNG